MHVQMHVSIISNMIFLYTPTVFTTNQNQPLLLTYLNYSVNRQCDDLNEVLLTREEDAFHDQIRKEVMLTPMDATLKVEGTGRHQNGRSISDSSVIVCGCASSKLCL